jgi:hypothetical protein
MAKLETLIAAGAEEYAAAIAAVVANGGDIAAGIAEVGMNMVKVEDARVKKETDERDAMLAKNAAAKNVVKETITSQLDITWQSNDLDKAVEAVDIAAMPTITIRITRDDKGKVVHPFTILTGEPVRAARTSNGGSNRAQSMTVVKDGKTDVYESAAAAKRAVLQTEVPLNRADVTSKLVAMGYTVS